MAREADIHGFGATNIAIPTNAPFLIPEEAGQVSGTLKLLSGSSLEICGVPIGVTYTGTSLTSLPGKGYLLGTSEVFNYSGPARYYLAATGATAVCSIIRGYGPGF